MQHRVSPRPVALHYNPVHVHFMSYNLTLVEVKQLVFAGIYTENKIYELQVFQAELFEMHFSVAHA